MSSHKVCIPSGVRNVLLTSLNDRMKTWRRRSTSSITRKVKIEYMFQFTISKTFMAVSFLELHNGDNGCIKEEKTNLAN